ncbi:MAG: hypothetical protein ABI542_01255 [Gemmatimonadota bacterium]
MTDIRVGHSADGSHELSADLGGERVWFRVPEDRALDFRGDALAVAGLLPAMLRGTALEVDAEAPICPILLGNLHALQHVFQLWGPAFGLVLKVIPIRVATSPAPPGREIGAFFSGGVDGTHTLLEAPEPPEVAAMVRGVDFQLDNPVYDESLARNRAWLAPRGIALIPMSSNLRWVARSHGLGWGAYFGAGLAAFAHVYGFRKTWIAGGHSWKHLLVEGSHPCTDHLWSSETRTIQHHGRDSLRWEKLERIAKEPGALEILRVCWQDNGFNCGKCEKCLRTMVTLRLLGLTSANFPPLDDLRLVARFKPADESEAIFIEEAIALGIQRRDAAVVGALQSSLRRYRLRGLARDADTLLLGGLLNRARNSLKRG